MIFDSHLCHQAFHHVSCKPPPASGDEVDPVDDEPATGDAEDYARDRWIDEQTGVS